MPDNSLADTMRSLQYGLLGVFLVCVILAHLHAVLACTSTEKRAVRNRCESTGDWTG
jgi:hypothetical protein